MTGCAAAQHVTAVIPAGVAPFAVASNPVTHRIYVANNSHNILVIDGDTYTPIATISNGTYSPAAIAINPLTNKIYVANAVVCCPISPSTVTVIDGATNTTTFVTAGYAADDVAVNPVTNKIYVANGGTSGFGITDPGSVTVIDGATNATTTIVDPNVNGPTAVAVNPVSNKIYAANLVTNNVTVIDGVTNATTTVAVGTAPDAVGVNPLTNKIYVANGGSSPLLDPRSVTVIDGATNATTHLTDPNAISPISIAVNPVTNKIYVGNTGSNNLTVIQGASNAVNTVALSSRPQLVVVDCLTNQVYVAAGKLTVIDGATNTATVIPAPTLLNGVAAAVNPVTNKVYVADKGDTGSGGSNPGDIIVFDGATNATTTVAAGTTPVAAVVNPVTNRIYVPNNGASSGPSVTVIDGATNTPVTTVAAGPNPTAAAVNPITNKIYFSASPNLVTVIDGVTNQTTPVTVGMLPSALALNPATNKIYAANSGSSNVTVIDGNTNATTTVVAGNTPIAVVVSPVSNKIYVSNQLGNSVTVIDGATNTTTTVSVGTTPGALAINLVTGRVYVANTASNTVSVIDGNSNLVIATLNTGTFPAGIAVNPTSNRVFVTHRTNGGIDVFDGANNALIFSTSAGTNASAILFDPLTNKIYVANSGSSNVTELDAAFTLTTTIATGTGPRAFGLNPFANKIYSANGGSSNLTVISEQKTQTIPLTTTITPLTGNTAPNLAPINFSFTTATSFAPVAPPVQALYYRLDDWSGPWQMANGSAPNFNATLAPPPRGLHILYAFAGDAQLADGSEISGSGSRSSPIIGNIAAYLFLVGLSPTTTALSLTTGTNPSSFGQMLTFTANVAPSGASGTMQFKDGAANLGAPVAISGGMAALDISTLTVGVHSITAAYSGDNNFAGSTSPTLTQVVEVSGGTASTTSLAVNGGPGPAEVFFGVTMATTSGATFDVNVSPGTATGNVVLLDGIVPLGPLLTLNAGSASYNTQLTVGLHSVTAIYLGDGSNAGSESGAVVIYRRPRPKPR